MENDNKIQDNRICRAIISPSLNNEEWDFEAILTPAKNGQLRYSYENDEYFTQVLRTNRENIDTSRLDSGLPLLDNHPWDISILTTYGITVGYEFVDEGIRCKIKFGARADEALRNDVKNGIIKTVSVEGLVQKYSIERMPGQLPIYYADLWIPESVSFAPVPNDIGAQIEVQRSIQKQIAKPQQKEDTIFKSITNKF